MSQACRCERGKVRRTWSTRPTSRGTCPLRRSAASARWRMTRNRHAAQCHLGIVERQTEEHHRDHEPPAAVDKEIEKESNLCAGSHRCQGNGLNGFSPHKVQLYDPSAETFQSLQTCPCLSPRNAACLAARANLFGPPLPPLPRRPHRRTRFRTQT